MFVADDGPFVPALFVNETILTRLHYITLGTYDYVLSLEMFRLACIVAPWLLIQLHLGWVVIGVRAIFGQGGR